MNRNPNWTEEEIKLALELYLSHDLQWLARISDSTFEIVALSKILNNLDLFSSEKGDSFRSVGSIRMKLSNFKAIDKRYKKQSLSNIGRLDKAIYEQYCDSVDLLRDECCRIIKKHYKGNPSDVEREYLSRFDLYNIINEKNNQEQNYSDLYNSLQSFLKNTDFVNSNEIKQLSEKLNDSLFDYLQKNNRKEHGGINQEEVVKVGEYVRRSFQKAIDRGLLSNREIDQMMDGNWCKRTFHITHPFLLLVDNTKSFYDQARDKNGYIRYWKNPFIIDGKEYYACKEWYENNRKFVSNWLSSLSKKNLCDVPLDLFKKLCKDVKKIDSTDICIKVESLHQQYPEYESEVNTFIDYLVDEGVLISFQGSLREYIIDDYDEFFDMMENALDYVSKGVNNENR